jgi:hypothetical protein
LKKSANSESWDGEELLEALLPNISGYVKEQKRAEINEEIWRLQERKWALG